MDKEIEELKRIAALSGSLEDIAAHARAQRRAGLITDEDVNSIMNRAALHLAAVSREYTNSIHLDNFPGPQFWGYEESVTQKDLENIEDYDWEYPYYGHEGEQESVIHFRFSGLVPVVFSMYDQGPPSLATAVGLEAASSVASQVTQNHVEALIEGILNRPYAGWTFRQEYGNLLFSSEVIHVIPSHIAVPTRQGFRDNDLISYWNVRATGCSEPFTRV